MNKQRRNFSLAAAAFASTLAIVAAPARAADDAADAKKLVQAAEKTVHDFAANKDFPTFGPALAKAKAVMIKGYYGKAVSPVDIVVKRDATSADSVGLQAALKRSAK